MNQVNETEKHKRYVFWKTVLTVLVLFVLTDLFLWYFSTPVLRSGIQSFVEKESKGLYTVEFDRIYLELTTTSLKLENFKLIPNIEVYKKRKKNKNIKIALYKVSFEKLSFKRLHVLKLYNNNELIFNEISIDKPKIRIIGLPDKKEKSDDKYDAVHNDLYSIVSPYFKKLACKEISINQGQFYFFLKHSDKEEKTAAEKISIKLYNFELDKNSFKSKDKLFYSDDFDVDIVNYNLLLNDSIHQVSAGKLNISTKKTTIEILDVRINSILPDTVSIKGHTIYNIEAPHVLVTGTNLKKAWFDKDIVVDNLIFDSSSIKIIKPYQNSKKDKKTTVTSTTDFKDVYSLLKGKINSISVNEFSFRDATLELKETKTAKIPLYKVDTLSITLENFKLDSLAGYRKNKILYSENIELDVSNYGMKLKDNTHFLEAQKFVLSTKEKMIKAKNVKLTPLPGRKNKGATSLDIKMSGLEIAGADFIKVYNTGVLNIKLLLLDRPSFRIVNTYTQVKKKRNASVIYDLVSGYLNTLQIENTQIRNGNFQLSKFRNNEKVAHYKGGISILLKNFKLDENTAKYSDRIFYATGFDIDLKNYSMKSEKDLHTLEVGKLKISTFKSSIEINDFSYFPDKEEFSIEILKKYHKHDFKIIKFKSLLINDIDINKAIFDKELFVNEIILSKPEINIKKIQGLEFKDQDTTSLEDLFIVGEEDIFALSDSLSLFPDTTVFFVKKDTLSLNLAIDTLLEETYKQVVARLLKDKLNFIEIGKIRIDTGRIRIQKFDTTYRKLSSFKNNISLELIDFKIIPDSVKYDDRFMFSRNIEFNIHNFQTLLKDKSHNLKVGNIKFIGLDSLIIVNNLRIFPIKDSINHIRNSSIIYLPEIELTGINAEKILKDKYIELKEINISKPVIALLTDKNKNKKVKLVDTALKKFDIPLPKGINGIKIGKFRLTEGLIELSNKQDDTEKKLLTSGFSITLDKINIDSSNIAENFGNLTLESGNLKLSRVNFNIPNNFYKIKTDTISFSFTNSTIEVQNFDYSYDTTFNVRDELFKKGKSSTTEFHSPYVKAYGVNIFDIVANKILNLEKISFQNPDIKLVKYFKSDKKTSLNGIERKIQNSLSKNFNVFKIKKIYFLDASANISDISVKDGKKSFFSDISGRITDFDLDTAKASPERIFFADDITFRMKNYSTVLPSKMYDLQTGVVGISTSQQKLYVDYLSMRPKYSQYEFAKVSGKQKSVLYLEGKHLLAENVNLRKLANNQAVEIGKLTTDGLKVHIFKDKQLPEDSTARPVSPLEALKKAKKIISIDTIQLHESYLSYEQNTHKSLKTGTISIEDINGKISGITNDTSKIGKRSYTRMKFSGYIMGKSLLSASFRFPINRPSEYKFIGSADTMNLKILNPILENTAFLSINEGTANSIRFNIHGNDTIAEGTMRFRYNDLKITVKDTADARKGFTSMLANTILQSDNPKRKHAKLKEGKIFQESVKHKPVFNLWTQAILTGAFSSLGFKTKQMKKSLKVKKNLNKILKKKDRQQNKTDKKIEKEMEQELKKIEKRKRKNKNISM